MSLRIINLEKTAKKQQSAIFFSLHDPGGLIIFQFRRYYRQEEGIIK